MSTGEILIYQNQEGKINIDVRLSEDTVWLTQDQMAMLFGKAKSTINEHILNIYTENELVEEMSVRKIGISDFSTKPTNHYNLDVIISVGYRVKSQQGTQFRIWATQRLKEYIIKGFALNDDRFKSGNSMNYFSELQNRIREIRLSEKFFYQKIKDIYTTSIDYNSKDEKTITFFKIVQNKLLWAISQNTAAELIFRRIDANLPLLGMLSSEKKEGKGITKQEISIAKNYLNEEELKLLGLLVEQYLAFAETMAQQQVPMYMNDWISKLDGILQLNGRELLTHAGIISHEMAVNKSEVEFKKFKTAQSEVQKELSLKEIEEDIKRLKK
jgi:hypothetical protein